MQLDYKVNANNADADMYSAEDLAKIETLLVGWDYLVGLFSPLHASFNI